MHYSGTQLIQTPRGHAIVSVLSRLSEKKVKSNDCNKKPRK